MQSLWGSGEEDWSAKGSNRRSDGLLIIWKKDLLVPIYCFYGEGFSGLCCELKGQKCYMVNVYSSCVLDFKRSMWERLIELRNSWNGGVWCVAGEFNIVREASERVGRSMQRPKDAAEFNDFISLMNLVDFPTRERKFSWSNGSSRVVSRLERFLLSDGFIQLVSMVNQEIGLKDISYHNPVWLNCKMVNWEPKPFRTMNGWLELPGFLEFMEKA